MQAPSEGHADRVGVQVEDVADVDEATEAPVDVIGEPGDRVPVDREALRVRRASQGGEQVERVLEEREQEALLGLERVPGAVGQPDEAVGGVRAAVGEAREAAVAHAAMMHGRKRTRARRSPGPEPPRHNRQVPSVRGCTGF